jgi:hypothetical protein
VEFHLSIPDFSIEPNVDLPSFHRAASIQLYVPNLRIRLPQATHTLERLSLTGCCVDLGALVLRCPCLRVLRVTQAFLDAGINIQSESLQKLFVRTNKDFCWRDRINVDAPMLKQWTLSFGANADLSVSVVAPLLEKVSWKCSFPDIRTTAGLGPWFLLEVSLDAAASLVQRVIAGTGREETCLRFSNVYVLSLQVCTPLYVSCPAQLA